LAVLTPIQFTAEPYPEGYEWIALSPVTSPHLEPQAEENTFEVIFKVLFQPIVLNASWGVIKKPSHLKGSAWAPPIGIEHPYRWCASVCNERFTGTASPKQEAVEGQGAQG
jgi:hypothetical protein